MTIVAQGYGISPGAGGGTGGCIVSPDQIDADVAFEDPTALFPSTSITLDQIDVDTLLGDLKASFIPDPPTFTGPISTEGSAGGEFFAQDKDRQRILDLGWTIIKEIPSAGMVTFQVYGDLPVVRNLLDFGTTILYIDMQYNLYSLNAGFEVTSKFIEDSARNDRRII